ncbi:MAG TPA: hypothetical protein DDZ68_09275, partial [Parvularcula sp.]|nr:hypothetical protein [Parvularcula sp.]
AGDLGYALILNPYLVIKSAYEKSGRGVREDKYLALLARASEIGATDMIETTTPKKNDRSRNQRSDRP